MSYKSFAGFYDTFTADVGYKERAEYMLALFARFDKVPSLLLDVGCGTGGFSYQFAENGIEVIGVDPSAEMLSLASARQSLAEKPPIFLCQSAENLDLYGTIDCAVSSLDTINHIDSLDKVQETFKRIKNASRTGLPFRKNSKIKIKTKQVMIAVSSGAKFAYPNGVKSK